MGQIIRRPYRSLVDFSEVYQFMIDNYSVDGKRGLAVVNKDTLRESIEFLKKTFSL